MTREEGVEELEMTRENRIEEFGTGAQLEDLGLRAKEESRSL
jgi:hypothetical protein